MGWELDYFHNFEIHPSRYDYIQKIDFVNSFSTWENNEDGFLYEYENLQNMYSELELYDSIVLEEEIPENVLKSAAEMIVYLNFLPSKKILYLFQLIHKTENSLKQLIIGIEK